VSEALYSLKENGMELRDCRSELRPEDCVPADESLSLPELDAVSFGFLEGVSEPWLGAEPNISRSVL
jgi:hypothetical protein